MLGTEFTLVRYQFRVRNIVLIPTSDLGFSAWILVIQHEVFGLFLPNGDTLVQAYNTSKKSGVRAYHGRDAVLLWYGTPYRNSTIRTETVRYVSVSGAWECLTGRSVP
jgi:hypothetical protein